MRSLCELLGRKLCVHKFHQTEPEGNSIRIQDSNVKSEVLKCRSFSSGRVNVPEAWDALLQFEQYLEAISWGKQIQLGWMENKESALLIFQ
jgi:hypothetical protein